MSPAAAWERSEWIDGGGNGFMINNVMIQVGSVIVNTNETTNVTTGHVSITAYEWRNDSWQRINGTSLHLNQTMNFTATDGNFSVRVTNVREVGRFNETRLEVWTNANVTNAGVVAGGINNATGAGRPNLTITKTILDTNRVPVSSVTVNDIVIVTITINNTGNDDARNVTISDPFPTGFAMLSETVNNTVNQTINRNQTLLVREFQIRAIDPGTTTFPRTNVTAENIHGVRFDYQGNNVTLTVNELAALVFTPGRLDGTTVDYHMPNSRVNGSFTVNNTGTAPAQFVNIEFTLPDNVTISGNNITVIGNTATMTIDQIPPNGQRVINYSLSANAEGTFNVSIRYSYVFNGTRQEGTVQTVSFNAVGNTAIGMLLEYWFILLIPVFLVLGVVFFLWRRHREYKF